MNATAANGTTPKTFTEKIADRAPMTARFLRLMHAPGDVFEIRGLGIGDYDQTHAGFFDDPIKAAEAAIRLDLTQSPCGVYLTINPVKPELLCRIHNRIKKVKRGETSTDLHIVRRRWLFIDIDPERAGGISGIPATDEERDAAHKRAAEVREWLTTEFGWSEPVQVDSGNGCYLLYPIDLPNDSESTRLIKRVLAGVGAKWSDENVKIDATVCNAARICRLLGTANRKGDSTEARPHRFCDHLRGPDYLANGWADPLPVEKLEAVAALAPAEAKSRGKSAKKSPKKSKPQESPDAENGGGDFHHGLMVEEWLTAREVEFRESHTLADGRTCWPILCPFNPDHQFDACLTQDSGGKLGAKCLHNSCSEFGWQEFKEKIGKPDADHYEPPMGDGCGRIAIQLTTREHDINNSVIVALAADETIYQRSGQLVTVIQGSDPDEFVQRPDDALRIAALPLATVRELISKHVNFYTKRETKSGAATTSQHVPDWCSRAVHARGTWHGIRPLRGIISHPVVKPDGSVLATPGYDPQTGLILNWQGEPLVVADQPTRDDAVAAAGRLKSVVNDFPFETPAHRAGWLAFLLTPLIRHSFRHAITSPLFLIDANVRGSGKSLLADLVGMIVCGFEIPRMIHPKDDDEMRKRMLAILLSGDELILLDNVSGELGGQTLDAVLTGTVFKDRILGESRDASVAINTTFVATSNNATITGDLCRRTIHIRLASPLENPEERDGFRIPNILQYVREHRRELLADALTILRAYCVAGRPDQKLSAMGSFDDWSVMVRGPLVWCGEPDPWETRIEFARGADTARQTLADILRHWAVVDPEDRGVTADELLRRMEGNPHCHYGLLGAVRGLCDCKPGTLPTAKLLGSRLRLVRDRVLQGRKLVSRLNRSGVMVWRVETAEG